MNAFDEVRKRKEEMALRGREHPTWDGSDFSKPLSVAVEEIRTELGRLRGRLKDIAFGFPQWEDRVDCAIGGITCVISALYSPVGEMKMVEDHIAKHEKPECEYVWCGKTMLCYDCQEGLRNDSSHL